eukprot:8497957-Lingulodinium_polyedra.AAC.1
MPGSCSPSVTPAITILRWRRRKPGGPGLGAPRWLLALGCAFRRRRRGPWVSVPRAASPRA